MPGAGAAEPNRHSGTSSSDRRMTLSSVTRVTPVDSRHLPWRPILPFDMALDFDVLVIGTGPAGEKAAMQAAKLKKRVCIVDRRSSMGGSCLHRGTIPSKTLRDTIMFLATSKKRHIEGFKSSLSKNTTLAAMMQSKDAVIRGQLAVVEDRFERNDVEFLTGTAHFLEPNRMAVVDPEGGTTEVNADVIVLATLGLNRNKPPCVPTHTLSSPSSNKASTLLCGSMAGAASPSAARVVSSGSASSVT